MGLILIIDDDLQLSRSFAKILEQDDHLVATAGTGREGIAKAKRQQPDVAVVDIRLPDINGIEVFEKIHECFPKLPVIIITAFGTTETAIGAIQKGAYDYIYKPFDVPEMLQVIEKAITAGRCMSAPVDVNPAIANFTGQEALVGGSKEMLEVYKAIGRVAPTDATVLIRGESGTGKELASRAIYNHSLRLMKPYMVINCVAIPATLLESELFGYEKGAFTGAMHRKIGKIQQARGGTVFLDEIGDMPLSIQAKFLRLLQENNIERLGGRNPLMSMFGLSLPPTGTWKTPSQQGRSGRISTTGYGWLPSPCPPCATAKRTPSPSASISSQGFHRRWQSTIPVSLKKLYERYRNTTGPAISGSYPTS